MRIGFDISQTGHGKAGCGFFAHAMITAMIDSTPANRYELYPSFGDFFFDRNMPSAIPYGGNDVTYGPLHRNHDASSNFWNDPDLEIRLGTPDIVHSNNFWTPLQINTARLIYTLYDTSFMVDPDWTTEANRLGCFDGVFRSAIAADWVVAISEFSRAHYLKMFPHFQSDRVRVVHPCSRFTDLSRQGMPPKVLAGLASGSFWLSVGTIEPRKNQRRLLEAYKGYLDSGGAPLPLVLAGGKGWLMENFQAYIAELDLSDRVILTGYVSDDELIWLYRNCFASLYPSLFEGFGLPVLEGMQFGAPTLCSDTTSMPEVAGNSAILLSPLDAAVWTHAMLELVADPQRRRQLGLSGQQRAATFDWKKSATAMLEIYGIAMRQPKRRDMVTQTSPSDRSVTQIEKR